MAVAAGHNLYHELVISSGQLSWPNSLIASPFNPEVMGGKPCLRGMRVTVGAIINVGDCQSSAASIIFRVQALVVYFTSVFIIRIVRIMNCNKTFLPPNNFCPRTWHWQKILGNGWRLSSRTRLDVVKGIHQTMNTLEIL